MRRERNGRGSTTREQGGTVLRCAIYTRVSTEHGLEQEFNSLHAQRDASEAYIRSQAREGWRLLPGRYDDGGFSGGSLERPALNLLLDEVRARKVDVIVVYKVDRLTRSLADFAKLVELFDEHGVSFVSVTQAFNTTTSMGRLTLNVLLSFAQFEREVTGERIRDKIAASKQKGIWMGGTVPLGYRVQSRKLLIEEEEAETVRLIFRRYLDLGSLPALQQDLRDRGLVTRQRPLSTGRIRGGVPFTTGPLHQLLTNRIYLGEINHRDRSWPGEHQPIVERSLFDAVQERLAANRNSHHERLTPSEALLAGRIFDDRGNRMTPSHARKGPARYRYYVSLALSKGRKEEAGSVRRVTAPDVEQLVLEALRNCVAGRIRAAQLGGGEDVAHWSGIAKLGDGEIVAALLDRVVIGSDAIELQLQPDVSKEAGDTSEQMNGSLAFDGRDHGIAAPAETVRIPWTPPRARRRRAMILPDSQQQQALGRPMRDGVRDNILQAIARGRCWLDDTLSGRATDLAALARRADVTERSVRSALNLAFLSPVILRAVINGTLPRGISLSRLADLPMDWDAQHQALGMAPPSSPAKAA